MFLLLNILRHGGIKIVIGILSYIEYPEKEWTRQNIGK